MSASVKEAICHLRTPASFIASGTPYHEFVVEPGNSIYKNVHGIIPIGIKIPNIFGNISSSDNRVRVIPLDEGMTSVDQTVVYSGVDCRWSLVSVQDICLQIRESMRYVVGEAASPFVDCVQTNDLEGNRVALALNNDPAQPVIRVEIPVSLALKLGFTPDQFTITSDNFARFSATTFATNPPNMKGVDTVFVHLHGMTNGHLIQASDGQNYNVVQCVPLTNHDFGTYVYHEAPDVLGSRVHFDKVITFDSVRVQLTDSNMKQLLVPSNYEIELVLKIYHSDG